MSSELPAASRRAFVTTLAALWAEAVSLAQHQHGTSTPAKPAAPHQFTFFSPAEVATLQTLAARIVPADERSGGATAAKVEDYLDFILAHAKPELAALWHTGLASYAPQISGQSPARIDTFLEKNCKREFSPQTADEKFFVALKSGVTEAFYSSREGIEKELRYQGMGFSRTFPGYQGEPLVAPPNYRPLIGREEEE